MMKQPPNKKVVQSKEVKNIEPAVDSEEVSLKLSKEAEKLLRSIIVEEKKELKDDKNNGYKTLESKISEYLSHFILIGYNCNSESVSIVKSNSQQELDSLAASLSRFLECSGILNVLEGFDQDDDDDDDDKHTKK